MAFATIRRILRDQPVVVLGSAPLSEAARQVLSASDSSRLICVNGSIGTTTRKPDILVLNSREYDDVVWNDPKRWSEERKQLHEMMLRQSAHRSVRHLVLLLKSRTADQTFHRLHQQGTSWRGQTLLHGGQKMDLGRKAGIEKFATASNISAGLFATCLSLIAGARHTTLIGFSYEQAYAYIGIVPPDTRKHIPQDTEALLNLQTKHQNLTVLFS